MSGVGDLSTRYYPGANDMINPVRHKLSDLAKELKAEQDRGKARDCLVGLMGARLADQLIAQLYAAGFEITPIPAKPE